MKERRRRSEGGVGLMAAQLGADNLLSTVYQEESTISVSDTEQSKAEHPEPTETSTDQQRPVQTSRPSYVF